MAFGFQLLRMQESTYRWMKRKYPKLYGFVNMFSLFCVGLLRFRFGGKAIPNIKACKRPAKTLIVYEFEGCPFCKLVREVLCVLDLDYIVYPCPRSTLKAAGMIGESRFRPVVAQIGGMLQFPFLDDPNTGKKMYESDEIIKYLCTEYGENVDVKRSTWAHSWFGKFLLFKVLGLARPLLDMGTSRVPSKKPEQLLELWGNEPSPFVKLVREVLCSLELPYVMHTLPTGSLKREAFAKEHEAYISSFRKRLNLVQFPYLKDPNTNTAMFESADIVDYLKKTYQIGDYPNESWGDYGKIAAPVPETEHIKST